MSAYALPNEVDRRASEEWHRNAEVPPPGTRLGAYVVGEPIGNGGLGIVLHGTEVASGRGVAIKVLAPAAASEPEQVARFRREIKAAAKIGSNYVVRVIDSGDLDSGLPYLVMEHLEGKSLADVAKESAEPLAISCVVDWVLQAIHGIAEAHSLGIIHRDLKPANLFLARSAIDPTTGIVKVLDFGASKLTADSPVDPNDPGGVTVATSLIGSPRYMAPEQIRAALEVDARADVYALGATLYELLSGKPIFFADTLARIFAQVLWDMPESLATIRPGVPADLEAIVAKCLAKEPASRFQNVKDLAAELAPFASSNARTLLAELGIDGPTARLAPPPSGTLRMPRFDVEKQDKDAEAAPQDRTAKMGAFVLGAMRSPEAAPARPPATVKMQRFEPPLRAAPVREHEPARRGTIALPVPLWVVAVVAGVVAVGLLVVAVLVGLRFVH